VGLLGDNLIIGDYTASKCVGVYSGNDTNNVGNNIGELDDGFFNGDSGVLDGSEFIDDMVDGIPSIWPDGDFQNIDEVLEFTFFILIYSNNPFPYLNSLQFFSMHLTL